MELRSLVGSQSNSAAAATCSPDVAAEAVTFLLGQFRRSDIANPDTYIPTLVLILASYPEAVVRAVVDPRDGVATECGDFPPSTDKLKAACERHMAPIRARQAREQRPALSAPPVPREARKTYDELAAECEARGTMVPKPKGSRFETTELERRAAERELESLKARAAEPSTITPSAELLKTLKGGDDGAA